MHYKHCCVVDAKGFYKDYVLVQTENEEQTVVGYTMQEGDMLIDSETTPDRKQHAGSTGFVRPRWDEDVETWTEGASAEELATWEAAHPAPAVDLDTLRAAKQDANKAALADWLAAHPLTWADGNIYGVTEQDQTEMAFNLTKYQLQASTQELSVLEWHEQKKERHTFTFDQYKALFLAIDSYVDPCRRYQESIKQAIYEANTAEEINAIQIDYSTVGN